MKAINTMLNDLGIRRSDLDIKIRGRRYNRIRAFSLLWWIIRIGQIAIVIGGLYLFYVLLWLVMYPNVM